MAARRSGHGDGPNRTPVARDDPGARTFRGRRRFPVGRGLAPAVPRFPAAKRRADDIRPYRTTSGPYLS